MAIITATITEMNSLSNIFLKHVHMHKRGNAPLGYLTTAKIYVLRGASAVTRKVTYAELLLFEPLSRRYVVYS